MLIPGLSDSDALRTDQDHQCHGKNLFFVVDQKETPPNSESGKPSTSENPKASTAQVLVKLATNPGPFRGIEPGKNSRGC